MNEDKDCFSTNDDDNRLSPFSVRRFLSFQFHATENSVSRESQDDTIPFQYSATDNFLSRERQQDLIEEFSNDLIEEFSNDGSPPNKRINHILPSAHHKRMEFHGVNWEYLNKIQIRKRKREGRRVYLSREDNIELLSFVFENGINKLPMQVAKLAQEQSICCDKYSVQRLCTQIKFFQRTNILCQKEDCVDPCCLKYDSYEDLDLKDVLTRLNLNSKACVRREGPSVSSHQPKSVYVFKGINMRSLKRLSTNSKNSKEKTYWSIEQTVSLLKGLLHTQSLNATPTEAAKKLYQIKETLKFPSTLNEKAFVKSVSDKIVYLRRGKIISRNIHEDVLLFDSKEVDVFFKTF